MATQLTSITFLTLSLLEEDQEIGDETEREIHYMKDPYEKSAIQILRKHNIILRRKLSSPYVGTKWNKGLFGLYSTIFFLHPKLI